MDINGDIISKSNILNLLKQGVIEVKFKKVDGSERVMKCTLLESYVKPHEKTTDREKKVNEDVISVWDVEKEGWRSFRYDSVIDVYK
jgi:ribosomal protein L19E